MPLPWRLDPDGPAASAAGPVTSAVTGAVGAPKREAASPRTTPARPRSSRKPAHRRSRSSATRPRRIRNWVAAAGAGIVLLAVGLSTGDDGSREVTTTGETATPTTAAPPPVAPTPQTPSTGIASEAPDPADSGNGPGDPGSVGFGAGVPGNGLPAGTQPQTATPGYPTGPAEATHATSPDSPVASPHESDSAAGEPAANVPSPAGTTCAPGPLRINLNGACI